MKVVDSLWFTNIRGTVGIVIIEEDVTRDRKAYIGVVDGHSQEADTQSIIAWGNPLSISTLRRIISQLTSNKPKKEAGRQPERLEDVVGTTIDGDPLIKRLPGRSVKGEKA